ncbi:hypothetical protein OKW76_05670 [Sphingomonas sp. S1-29]|uniref:hypothetical protein n=1 Tax=Sphingomonas sp. S1-29 TaxID=2991074 RepID=UPI00223EF19A|nr:hypothetical protein [Sphingomonas sp. S1-29]UZK70531.1 hypothetical protein OKW76_05670 [Sphingomonas sp. S1-29]
MTSMGVKMRDGSIGTGEQAARLRQRRIRRLFAALAAAGFVTGLVMALLEDDAKGPVAGVGALPPAFAIGAVVLGIVAILWGGLRYWQSTDELDRRDNMLASMIGLNMYALTYPAWWTLWKGALVPAPNGETIFMATMIVTAISYGWLKYRN